MKYFELVVDCGHVGAGRSLEVTRYFEANSLLDAYDSARYMPRSKKKSNSIKRVQEITFPEYQMGKVAERENNYLNTFA